MQMEQLTPQKSVIACRNLNKKFHTPGGVVEAVSHLDLDVKKNEFLVLFGPGQCGKSTIINCLAGLDEATAGEVLLDGRQMTGPGPDRGVVYQTINLFPWLTVMGNVEFGLKQQGVDKKTRQEKARHYIKLVGLEGFEDSYPNQLSGGMKQRVGIARAYCIEPEVLLMDEPFGHLDAQTRYLMQEEIIRIWELEKRTVVFVTNNIEEAIYLADRIIVLSEKPAEVKAEYVIPLKRPRDYVDSEFLRLRQEIMKVSFDRT